MFKAWLVNYFGLGSERKYNPDGSWCLCLIRLKLGKYNVLLEQEGTAIANKRKHPQGTVHTSTLTISGVKSYSEGEKVAHDICSLLSLASMSQVRAYHFEFGDKVKTIAVVGEAMYFRPLIQINNGNAVKLFVESTWSKYRKLKRSRKLPEVIEMLTTCELPKIPLEVKLGQIFIILENLKSTYANYNKVPFKDGFYRELSNTPKSNSKKGKRLSFEILLQKMLKSVGMSPGLKRIIRLRNEIIHFGLSRKPYESLSNNYDFCHDVVREYLLRLLEYKGDYLIYSKASRVVDRI